jgi:hypothetical protein
VTKFVAATQFTGQIAFDFIEMSDGQLFALECNPRTTSGVHTLADQPGFVDSFFDESMSCLTPGGNGSHMLATAMLMYGLSTSVLNRHLGKWLRAFFSSSDVIFDGKDLKPFLLQYRSIFHYLKLARENGISALEASTFDIEWNGEDRTR